MMWPFNLMQVKREWPCIDTTEILILYFLSYFKENLKGAAGAGGGEEAQSSNNT